MRRMLTSLRVTFVTNKTSNRLGISQELFNRYRQCELAFAIFANIGVVTSIIDYETSYSSSRNHYNCHQEHTQNIHKVITLFSSLIAMIFLFLKHSQKEIWIDYQRETEKILNKSRTRPYFSTLAVNEKQSTKIARIIEIASLCMFPYPYLNGNIIIPMRWQFQDLHACYTLDELMYALIFIRILFLFKALSNYTIYKDHLARRYCTFYRTSANARFSFKCIIAKYPLSVIIICMTVPALIVLGLILRIFERPFDDLTGQDFQDVTNAFWVCTTFLIGEGFTTFVPASLLSQCILAICFLIGSIIYTLTLLTLWNKISMNDKQETVFVNIQKADAAAMLICGGFSYYLSKIKHGSKSFLTEKALEKLYRYADLFKEKKSEILTMNSNKNRDLLELNSAVQDIENKLGKLVDIHKQIMLLFETPNKL